MQASCGCVAGVAAQGRAHEGLSRHCCVGPTLTQCMHAISAAAGTALCYAMQCMQAYIEATIAPEHRAASCSSTAVFVSCRACSAACASALLPRPQLRQPLQVRAPSPGGGRICLVLLQPAAG